MVSVTGGARPGGRGRPGMKIGGGMRAPRSIALPQQGQRGAGAGVFGAASPWAPGLVPRVAAGAGMPPVPVRMAVRRARFFFAAALRNP